jgi:hypothetical protein
MVLLNQLYRFNSSKFSGSFGGATGDLFVGAGANYYNNYFRC